MPQAQAQQTAPETRRRVRTDGTQSLTDVARLACGDVRLTALLNDLNPALPSTGRLACGTNVVCPSKSEAQVFAKKMGFAIGYSPEAPQGTAARRRWAAHVGAARPAPALGAEALATALLACGLSAGEAGRRLAEHCAEAELEALSRHADQRLRAAGVAAVLHALYPRAKRRLHAARSVLEATGRPGGFRTLLEGCARDPQAADQVLAAVAVAAPLRAALIEEAPRVCALLARGRKLNQLERGARDASLKGERPEVAALVAAIADGVEPLSAERIAALGLQAEADALLSHAAQLQLAMAAAEAGLAKNPDAIRALAQGTDAPGLARPWPLLATICRQLGAHLDALPPSARDDGLGGLISKRGPRVSQEGPAACLSVAELQARAALCARTDDEGDALAVRLVDSVVALFGLLRPAPAVEGGTPSARRARRRAAFDHAIAARGDVSAEGAATLVSEALERAREGGLQTAVRLTRQQIESAAAVARGLQGALSVQRRPMSELGRALVVGAMALDREIGQGLARPTGREALTLAAQRHAARVLSAASCRIAAGA